MTQQRGSITKKQSTTASKRGLMGSQFIHMQVALDQPFVIMKNAKFSLVYQHMHLIPVHALPTYIHHTNNTSVAACKGSPRNVIVYQFIYCWETRSSDYKLLDQLMQAAPIYSSTDSCSRQNLLDQTLQVICQRHGFGSKPEMGKNQNCLSSLASLAPFSVRIITAHQNISQG